MDSVKNTFLKGLLAVIPITATIFLLVWLGRTAENQLGDLIKVVLPESAYIPGMGLVAALVLIFFIGVLLNAWIAQRFLAWAEDLLLRLPLIKSIYNPMKDLMGFFSTGNQKGLGKVVMIDLGDERKLFGILTRDSFNDFDIASTKDKVAVYFPMSYQIGGYTLLVPKEQVTEVDIPVDRALTLMVTGWVKSEDK